MSLNKYLCPGIYSVFKILQLIPMQGWERTTKGELKSPPSQTHIQPAVSLELLPTGPCSILWPSNILLISLPHYLELENWIWSWVHLVFQIDKSFHSSEAPNREVTCLRSPSESVREQDWNLDPLTTRQSHIYRGVTWKVRPVADLVVPASRTDPTRN